MAGGKGFWLPLESDAAAHIADTSDAHDASAISYAGGTGIVATDVEAAIDELATEKADWAGGTFTGDISVPDEAYDATTWNGSVEVPTKNAVRDKIESLGGGGAIRVEDEGSSVVAAATALNFAGAGVTVTDAGSNEALVTIPGGGSGWLIEAISAEVSGQATTATEATWTGAEVTIDDAILPSLDVSVRIDATGVVVAQTDSDRMIITPKISLDGGTTWVSGTFAQVQGTSARNWWSVFFITAGTVTGDVKGRVTIWRSAGTDRTISTGRVGLRVSPTV